MRGRRRPLGGPARRHPAVTGAEASVYTVLVVIFFEVLLVLAAILIAWFSLYVVYRLVTDKS